MKSLTIRRLRESGGFAHHFLLPVVAVLAVAGIGAYILHISSAATADYYTSTCIKTTFGPPNSAFNQCTQDTQVLLNAIQHHDAQNVLHLTVYAGSSFNYGPASKPLVYLLMNGLYGKYTGEAVTAVTGNKNGQLTTGNSGSWQNLCRSAYSVGLQNDTSVLDFSSVPNTSAGVTGGSRNTLLPWLGGKANGTKVTNAAAFKYDCGNGPSTTPSGGTTTTSGSTTTKPPTTTASGCTAKTFQAGSADSGSSHCVQYLQQMINGRDSYIITKLDTSVSNINGAPISALTNGQQFYSVNSQFGTTGGSYSTGMQGGVKNLQTWDNAPNANDLKLYFNMTLAQFNSVFKPKGNLPTTGVTESKTWYDTCQWISHIPTSSRTVTNSTDYTGGTPNSAGSNRTNMWYLRSYMRTAVTAAADAGCTQ